jgi:Nucleotidyl transferase AbiEii toxin, Type IV TA system
LSDDTQRELREVQAYSRLPGVGLVEKDLHVVRAIAALAATDAAPYTLVFGGGTALARAHKLVRRMSEDVDFKIVPRPAAPVSRSVLRQQLGALRDRMTDTLQAAGFVFDPSDPSRLKSHNESHYIVYQLPYEASGAGEGLRSTIQIEMTYASLRLEPVMLPVSSFVAEAQGRPPEVPTIACVSISETAAEKLVSLTRRTAMDLASLSRGEPDVALVRHIYDLHQMRGLIEHGRVAALARDIAAADADIFRNQYPAYHADIAGETHKAVDALQADPVYHERYHRFLTAMVHGERPEFDEAMAAVATLARSAWP